MPAPPGRKLTMHVSLLQTGNYSLDELPDLPAAFGPSVPPEGVSGLLMVSTPPLIGVTAAHLCANSQRSTRTASFRWGQPAATPP